MSGADEATTAVDTSTLRPIAGPEAAALAAAENARFAGLLRGLGPDEWRHPTDCPGWDVRAMAGHVLGMAQTFGGVRAMVTSMAAAARRAGDGPLIDGLTALQVDANAGLTAAQLVTRLDAAGPVQARWRGSRRLMRRIPVKNVMRDGTVETWTAGYLFDRILTRDTWMHRSDIAEATGRAMTLTAEHDGRIVADVVAEWAGRHGQPFELELTGPAGGRFRARGGGPDLRCDAVAFCRILSGRGTGEGLLATEVPF